MQDILGASVLSLLDPADRTATANGPAVDILDYEGYAAAILQSAAGTGTTPTLEVKLPECGNHWHVRDWSCREYPVVCTVKS